MKYNLNTFYNQAIFSLFLEDLFFLKEYRDMCDFINAFDRNLLRELRSSNWMNTLDQYQYVKIAFEKWIDANHLHLANRLR